MGAPDRGWWKHGGRGSGREPGRLGHRARPAHRARRRVLRRGGDGSRLAARGADPHPHEPRQARPAGGPARPGPQPVPVRGADRGHPGHPAVRHGRRGDAGRAPEDGPAPSGAQLRLGRRPVADHRHRGDLLLHPGTRRAGPQAPGPAAAREGRDARRAHPGPDLGAGPSAGVAAVPVDQPGGPDPRRRPGRRARGDDRGGAARPGRRSPGAERRRAAHRGRGVQRGQAADPRGAGAPDRGGVPGRGHAAVRGHPDRGRRAVLPLPGLPAVLRRRDRLHPRPGPDRPAVHLPPADRGRDQPAGEIAADEQDRAVGPVGDAPGQGSTSPS